MPRIAVSRSRIRSRMRSFAANGFALREWEKVRTDTITLSAMGSDTAGQSAAV